MRDVIRRNWRFWVTLAEVLVLTAFFVHHIEHRQNVMDQRNERQREAICAILANIPGHIPAEIAVARRVFARPDHPGDCQPIRRPTPKPTPAPDVTVTPPPRRAAAAPAGPTVTDRPASRPSARPTRTPASSPSPTPTCITVICLGLRWSDGPALREMRPVYRRWPGR